MNIILGIFADRAAADAAVRELNGNGYKPEDISIIVRDKVVGEETVGTTGGNVVGGAASGAATGSVVGGIAGVLLGVGAISLPGLGAILIGGPLAVALGLTGAAALAVEGAVTGALAGGLVGGLVGLGVPTDVAQVYEDRVREGAILVAVPVKTGGNTRDAREILNDRGATEVRSVPMK